MTGAVPGTTEVEVRAPSRLHFGLLAAHGPGARQFGGVGAMIDRPGLWIRIRSAAQLQVSGKHQGRTERFVQRFLAATQREEPRCHIEILQAAPEHVGLGTGTQLALAVASGLVAFLGQRPLDPGQLAAATGRGLRSSVGSHGFRAGGLLLDLGKSQGDGLSTLGDRARLPEDWRWLLIRPRGEQGLSGPLEHRAFQQLPVVPTRVSQELAEEIHEWMFPAARAGDPKAFGESIYRYGVRAGACFASQQEGSFATHHLAQIVARCRDAGVSGVGQSSWGPTVFALFENEAAALAFEEGAESWVSDGNLHWMLAEPNNCGATVSVDGNPIPLGAEGLFSVEGQKS